MMDELVKLVMEKTGLGEEQAKQAVETVLGFLEEKLPDPVAGQLKSVLSSEAALGQADKLIDKGISGLGGLLGKKK